ncbi:MAG: S24 family peptidase [Caldimonas sp.]
MLRERGTVSASTPRARVAISFGSPAGASGVTRLDLNDILIRNPQAAFLVRISGSAMREAGIDDGDLALVDRALEARHGHVVLAVHQNDFLCRRLCMRVDAVGLQATDPAVPEVWAGEADVFDIWGVVTHVVKQVSG